MGPGPPEWRPRPAPPLTKLRHFRRVRLASAGRGMAALRSWLSRSVSSFFRYRRGVGVGGRDGRRRGDAESARRGRCAGLAGLPFPYRPAPLSGPRASRLGGAGSSLTGGFSVIPPAEREPPASRCLPGAARPARQFPLLSKPGQAAEVFPADRRGRGLGQHPRSTCRPGVVCGDCQTPGGSLSEV